MNLVIVESPAKAKTINKYLGSDYKVLASYGHVRDLPSKNGSVDTDHDFKMVWEIDPGSKKHLKEITDYAIDADRIILATDPDREGEAIAWHLKCILEENKKIKDKKFERVVFNEITKKAVENGISNPRDINPELVNAYMARRALDYLVGFNISPILASIDKKPYRRSPYAPFTTSTMQQEASKKLGFSASRTMQIAQRLYQGIDFEGDTVGLITYMRTDGTNISQDAIKECRNYIDKEIGKKYLPSEARNYSGKKAKNAQEAHEAIRPTDILRTPDKMKSILDKDQARLYELIWNRTLASQMENAEYERCTLEILNASKSITFRATGSVQVFDGFLKLYQDVKEEDEIDKDEESDQKILPEVKINEKLENPKFNTEQHFTEPPPRFSEASLVKKLEELGIGRPSTYASIISVLSARNYVELITKRFIPTDRGKLITAFLDKLFTKYVDYNFTATLEDSLDEITTGKIEYLKVLENFWKEFYKNINEVKELRTRAVLDLLNESLGDIIFDKDESGKISKKCKNCSNGELSLKNGRFGAFIGCSNYPECKFTRPLSRAKAAEQDFLAEPKVFGETDNKEKIVLKKGRFGPYLQIGNDEKNLRNVSIPKGISLDSLDIDKCKFLASLPKVLGQYPENSQDITLNVGRFGPYVKCENKSASLENPEDIFSLGLNRAITLIAEAKPGRRTSNEIKNLGEHPEDKKPVKIMKGQYGPYIKYKTINATIPDDKDPENISMEEALVLIAARIAYDESKGGKKTRKKSKKDKTEDE
ncbi:MAG: type I DNA topoisomerase [Candidatus Fonsibacter lacus]|uniref:DNA topoisomerase 1 n=2 Tax=Candidatus Fonsibacter lacus TaxID=2576439 RepID=A0A845SDB6_9PROT|nr:type I DNA topoisomerase [Candidatus Fonsibacter lacus]